jgi:hypothetical protein
VVRYLELGFEMYRFEGVILNLASVQLEVNDREVFSTFMIIKKKLVLMGTFFIFFVLPPGLLCSYLYDFAEH